MRAKFLHVLLGLASAILAFNATAAAAPADRPTLRVGIATNYPPLAFKQDGEITGVEAQFARQLSDELNTEMSLVETRFEELIPALLAGRIDVIMSGMSITDERKKSVSFTQPYLRVGQMALLRGTDAERLRGAAAFNQPTTRIGVVTGTTGAAYARRQLTQAKIQDFAGVDEAVAALRDHRIDVFIYDAPAIWRVAGGFHNPDHQLVGRYEPLTEEYLAWAVRKDDALRERLDAVLRKWQDNGELERVLDRWIRTRRWTTTTPGQAATQ